MGADPQPSLIFLHISKTGGSTLRGVILRQYGREAVYESNRRGSFEEFLSSFRTLSPGQRSRIRVFMGHMAGFGLHSMLPGPAKYVTVLRDPIDRAVSAYYHIMRLPSPHPRQEYSLLEWIERAKHIHNAQTRRLSGWQTPRQTGQAMLDDALENLERHFAVAGLAERYDESLVLMRRALGWRIPVYVRSNVGTNRPRGELPADVRRAIEEKNQLDIILYRHAADRLAGALRRGGSSVRAEVRVLRSANRLLETVLAKRLPVRPAVNSLLKAVGRA